MSMDSPQPLKASIIIPSFNGAHKIYNVLNSIAGQSLSQVEIIVVVDGSTDNTLEVLKAFESRLRNFKIVTQANGGRSVARNSGARAAKTGLLIFYDDDVAPASDSIQKHFYFHEHKAGILCGDAIEIFSKHKPDIHNYKAWLTAKWTGKYADVLTRMEKSQLFFTAANCSVSKSDFEKLNGFDENLTDSEDYDLAFRALENGISVYYDKSNKALHLDDITCRTYVKRLREYAAAKKRSEGYFAGKSRKPFALVKKILYRVFAFRFWVRLVDSGALAFLLPRRFRYALYTIIIQALAYEHEGVSL